MGHQRRLLATALLIATAAGAAAASVPTSRPVVEDRVETYPLDAVDAAGLTHQMAERGPVHDGRRAWAYTAWEIRSRYTPVQGSGGCRLEAPQVRLEVVTTLPHWTPPPEATAHLRARWARLQDKLRAHEQVHRAHALEAAQDTLAALMALPVEADCELAALRAQEALRAHVQLARQRSDAFDRETDYGAQAGVRLRD